MGLGLDFANDRTDVESIEKGVFGDQRRRLALGGSFLRKLLLVQDCLFEASGVCGLATAAEPSGGIVTLYREAGVAPVGA